MIKHDMQYLLSPGDLILSPPYLYFQIAVNMDLSITRNELYKINTFAGNRVNIIHDLKVLFDSDKCE